MERLGYEALEKQGYKGFLQKDAPVRMLQFGAGNFLRGFTDYFVDVLNEKHGLNMKIMVVQSTGKARADALNGQDGLYTVCVRGLENGKTVDARRVVSSIGRCVVTQTDWQLVLDEAKNPELRFIVSNTTEAGITFDASCGFDDNPPASFPAKLARFLYERYRVTNGDAKKGFIILPCELMDNNGEVLKDCILRHAAQWKLEAGFAQWLDSANIFCGTLVDRIVTGYPDEAVAAQIQGECGYEDKMLTCCEPFAMWKIQGPKTVEDELKLAGSGLPVDVIDDVTPFKIRKVRILNGAHTATVYTAFLMGYDIVRDYMYDDDVVALLQGALDEEIIPFIPMDKANLDKFAAEVFERFRNPFIDHRLLGITLNSMSKWTQRLMPSLVAYYEKHQKLAPRIVFSFAAFVAFFTWNARYEGGKLIGQRDGEDFAIDDDAAVVQFFGENLKEEPAALMNKLVAKTEFFGDTLQNLPGFAKAAADALADIRTLGAKKALEKLLAGV